MNPVSIPDLPGQVAEASRRASAVLEILRATVRRHCEVDGRLDGETLIRLQSQTHGLAWFATYGVALQQMLEWSQGLMDDGRFGETESLILQIAFGEYLGQFAGGIPMSQGEIARIGDFGLDDRVLASLAGESVHRLVIAGTSGEIRARLAECLEDDARAGATTFGDLGQDGELDLIRDQFRRFADDRIRPHAQRWHLEDALIPLDVIREMAELGVFGLTIPEPLGGLGMSKTAMCVVSEELSRGYIGIGSLGTRSEIAAELVICGGTDDQKSRWLPALGSGTVIPTAVFTEPAVGSDLGALRTRAERDGDDTYRITGSKTWITHGARAGLMTLLARTDSSVDDHTGLSMFLAEKSPGTLGDPFPDAGISGSEIRVLGYRGMKEYEIAFDGFRVDAANLLGRVEGQGFRQLMRTFESARIQTAARAIGVAQSALDLALAYACERRQFGQPIIRFPRVHAKLAMMAVEIMIARQLTYHAARRKDSGHRCDLEAGMAKLLAARVAWACADNAVQIHGGTGFAEDHPVSRILCDARILSIFEGAAEIQAQVIARRLLEA
ncbi:MAG: acyl-CoA dehydrogenase family protein [Paracoccaceae bacterium]|nr:acyl-CoA dehydrogenase family protein [Paracoccaceae bacterium]MDE2913126.1 acyl-CoA dehydrogenase family protein [Paracoccaceae bacterium]